MNIPTGNEARRRGFDIRWPKRTLISFGTPSDRVPVNVARRGFRVLIDLRDCWIGAYWRYEPYIAGDGSCMGRLDVYVCPLPFLVFHFGRQWDQGD